MCLLYTNFSNEWNLKRKIDRLHYVSTLNNYSIPSSVNLDTFFVHVTSELPYWNF